jgi:hypothetical protein
MHKLIEVFNGLSRRGKVLASFAAFIVVIAVVELFTGCSSMELVKTWSF